MERTLRITVLVLILTLSLTGCRFSSTKQFFTPKEGANFTPQSDTNQYSSDNNNTNYKKSPYEVAVSCDGSYPKHRYEQELYFPDPGTGCAWNQEGNGARQDLEVRARLRQEYVYNLPEGAVICNVEFSSEEQNMRFDDEIILLLNDRVMLSSDDYSHLLSETNGFYMWDWDDIYGSEYAITSDPGYCLGRDDGLASCQIPQTQTWGHIAIEFAPELMFELSSELSEDDQLRFSFITTGDNDDSDCRHEDYRFTVGVDYVIPSGILLGVY